ncbi:MAG: hypothetical protein ABSD52_08490 [Candidatus Cybelea sp.]|jgi:hypothetical protein
MESSVVSALRRALRYTVGTATVALVGSNLLPETDAERLATTAYLAVIFAAVTLAVLHFVSGGATAEQKRPLAVTFPTALLSVVLVTIVLLVGAALAGQPGAEGFAFLVCAVFTALMALSGAGIFRALHVALVAGTRPAALTRYAVLVAIVALLLATVLPGEMRSTVVEGACWADVVAAICLSVSLIRRTGLGRFVMAGFRGGPTRFFERTIGYAAYACAGALLAAALFPQSGDTLAFSAYVAIVIATVGVAVETRVRLVAASRRATSISNPR